ncbi:CRP/FNR family transcriptional regulator [Dysgonomonas sp. PFB1-18]|uniref:Crp/Fnr family transcriptional regulator n=1 Tax=unclassified Dysgonomonas TaxID=2630389 RepID=UPI0024747795|nr:MULTISPECIES: Crp/Fnr family transcriptional regulator [unclassified Dysgonomonas]MDH6307285.1 CRP/FNR family transcriptional regulator [Dysgonomonas sp. PF1-14]MDH6337203.1 CRP/FNR family transcriptional regulator [Dysgonomonas sp. PF1-16]MDH6379127.1 CRP/FNR family transcriptional regulator [Dysgonomonas sp. PFB1-18]MDH6396235.1 CRP/FNR family transcriptional regulator [Dysgonomonas sp. PF1-23]
MYTKLINHIQDYVQLQESDLRLIENSFEMMSLQNKAYLLREGQTCRCLYFVAKGCLRMHFYTAAGVEQITQFAIENWWIADYAGFMRQTVSEHNIQAIEKSEILAINLHAYDALLEEVPALERYFRIMAQRALGASQYRLKQIYDMSKEDIYLHFRDSFPEFVQRVPQYMLASFLGLSPEYLSTLRKKHVR